MKTDLGILRPTATELGQIRRHLQPQRRPYHPARSGRPSRPCRSIEVDEYELDLVEIFARHDLQLHPDAD
ncbi:hypothetical protein [Shinella sp.]|uniref:hypothetical protein n=1 Tax=Shinella sp. TaxID=1870904 RepID=UPI00289CDC31|nr:hypothetical protein [Shinella sp.]